MKIRITLAVFSAVLTAALGLFIWIMLDAPKSGMSSVLSGSLLLIVCVTIAAQVIYAVKGQIFEVDGRLARREILFAIICFQVIMQFSFGFSLYAVNQTELQNKSFDDAYAYFITLQQSAAGNTPPDYQALDLEAGRPACVEAVFLADSHDTRGADGYFRFPVNGGKLLMRKSRAYFNGHLRDFAVSLLMSLVISVLLMAELVYLAIKVIDRRAGGGRERNGEFQTAGYLRQIAFLFYFSGYLGSSFIPILARDLSGGNPNADFIAGLPYSVEALANCLAILLATQFFGKKGWKPPYMMGVCIFVAGLLLSALSPTVGLFIAARAVAGAGYGFCWMTLRNITTLSGGRAENFANLSSGIYAGIMCGVAFGAVLADSVGYRAVLLISAAMAAAAAFFPMSLRNQTVPAAVSQGGKFKLSAKGVFVFAAFLALFVIPTCVSEAFCGYAAPLYISRMGLPTAYVGRVSLVYNLCLVYISSTLLMKLVRRVFKNPLYQCALHMLFISAALMAAAYFGGFQAMVAAGALLGCADGFGFSVQNAYVLDTQAGERLGHARMLTWFSLFKKFGATLGPAVLGLFMANGFRGLGVLGTLFAVCLAAGIVTIQLFNRGNGNGDGDGAERV